MRDICLGYGCSIGSDMAPDNRGGYGGFSDDEDAFSKCNTVGEQADYIVDQMGNGNWGSGYVSRPPIKCKDCGSKKVFWGKTKNDKWCLCDKETSNPHSCSAKNLQAGNLPITSEDKKKKCNFRVIKSCNSCENYFIGGRCIKNDFGTGRSYVCDDWEISK